MQEAFVRTTINEAGIATITFFHPQSNSMPGSQLAALAAEIEKAGNNDAAKVIVLRSEGEKAFCAGASFDELIAIKDRETGLKFFRWLCTCYQCHAQSTQVYPRSCAR